jgi:hypothetical protein
MYLAAFKKFVTPMRVRLFVVGLLILVLGFVLAAAFFTRKSLLALRNYDFVQAATLAQNANFPVRVLSVVTLRQLPDLEAWRLGLEIISTLPADFQQADNLFNAKNNVIDLKILNTLLAEKNRTLGEFTQAFSNSTLSRFFPGQQEQLFLISAQSLQLEKILSQLIEIDQEWIVVLQNSDELRAAGGFAGSYLRLPIHDGTISSWVVEDIYDADGRFTGYVAAPPGVKEYLSSANGLRLPDANWEADFSDSAQQMLQFFALGDKTAIDGLVAENLPLVEALLRAAGPISLTDYDALLTEEDLSIQLRDKRDEFFPGSIQKKHMLTQAVTALMLQLYSLDQNQRIKLLETLNKALAEKHLLAYARNPELQAGLEQLGITGSLNPYQAEDFVYFLESNVGINKANRNITRKMQIDWQQEKITTTITFENNNFPKTGTNLSALIPEDEDRQNRSEADHNGYANYQRIIIPKGWRVENILYRHNQIAKRDERDITSGDQTFTEIGFLITLAEQQQGDLVVQLIPDSSRQIKNLVIQKQPGVLPYPVRVTTPVAETELLLDSDKILPLPGLN